MLKHIVGIVLVMFACKASADDQTASKASASREAQSLSLPVPAIPAVSHGSEVRGKARIESDAGMAYIDLWWEIDLAQLRQVSIVPTARLIEVSAVGERPAFQVVEYRVPIAFKVPLVDNLQVIVDPYRPGKAVGSVSWRHGGLEIKASVRTSNFKYNEITGKFDLVYRFP